MEGGEGDKPCGTWAVNGQSPWVGSGQRPHSVAPHLYFWVGYLASGNLSPWACQGVYRLALAQVLVESGLMEIPQDTVNMGLAACFPQVCLQDPESKYKPMCNRVQGWAWFGGSSCFLNLRGSRPSGQWKHLDLKAQQPLRLVSGPLEGRWVRPVSPLTLFLQITQSAGCQYRETGVVKGTQGALCTGTSTQGMWAGEMQAKEGQVVGLRKQGGAGVPWTGCIELGLSWALYSQAGHSLSWPLGRRKAAALVEWPFWPQALSALALQVPVCGLPTREAQNTW